MLNGSVRDSDRHGPQLPNHLMPALYEHSEPRKVKIDFSASQAGSNAPEGVFRDATEAHPTRPGHDGMRDIGSPGDGNRVLLLRALNYHSTMSEIAIRLGQEIARMMGKRAQVETAQRAICRLVAIRDQSSTDNSSRSSWGYCFVELATSKVPYF